MAGLLLAVALLVATPSQLVGAIRSQAPAAAKRTVPLCKWDKQAGVCSTGDGWILSTIPFPAAEDASALLTAVGYAEVCSIRKTQADCAAAPDEDLCSWSASAKACQVDPAVDSPQAVLQLEAANEDPQADFSDPDTPQPLTSRVCGAFKSQGQCKAPNCRWDAKDSQRHCKMTAAGLVVAVLGPDAPPKGTVYEGAKVCASKTSESACNGAGTFQADLQRMRAVRDEDVDTAQRIAPAALPRAGRRLA